MILRSLAILLSGGILGVAAAAQYSLDPASGMRLSLEVEKTGLLAGKKHQFVFPRYHGTLVYDPGNIANSSIQLTIESASVVCEDTWVKEKDREKILKYALNDMLAASRFPQLTFRSTTIKTTGDKQFQSDGLLTIRDKAKPVSVLVSLAAGPAGDLILDGSAALKLSDYGLKPASAALGAIGTKDRMTVKFHLAAVRSGAKPAAGKKAVEGREVSQVRSRL